MSNPYLQNDRHILLGTLAYDSAVGLLAWVAKKPGEYLPLYAALVIVSAVVLTVFSSTILVSDWRMNRRRTEIMRKAPRREDLDRARLTHLNDPWD